MLYIYVCLPDLEIQSEDTDFPPIIGPPALASPDGYPSDIEEKKQQGGGYRDKLLSKDCNPDNPKNHDRWAKITLIRDDLRPEDLPKVADMEFHGEEEIFCPWKVVVFGRVIRFDVCDAVQEVHKKGFNKYQSPEFEKTFALAFQKTVLVKYFEKSGNVFTLTIP